MTSNDNNELAQIKVLLRESLENGNLTLLSDALTHMRKVNNTDFFIDTIRELGTQIINDKNAHKPSGDEPIIAPV